MLNEMERAESVSEIPPLTRELRQKLHEEVLNRDPSEMDLKNIHELRNAGYKPAFIATALEFDKPVLLKILRKLDRMPKAQNQ